MQRKYTILKAKMQRNKWLKENLRSGKPKGKV